MNWVRTHEDSSCIIYTSKDTYNEHTLFFNKNNLTCTCTYHRFLTNEGMWEPQQQAADNVKFSARYGHWQILDADIDLETAELIVDILRTLKHEKEQNK